MGQDNPDWPLSDRLGLCQWFHYEDYEAVEYCVEIAQELGVKHLRTGISWADYHRPKGKEWYDFQMKALESFEVLLSIWHTPPSISENGACSGPPKRLEDFADFTEEIGGRYTGKFQALELWNEPNNRLKWDFISSDPGWKKFASMVAAAALRAKSLGVVTVLGGIIPVDTHYLSLLDGYGALEHLDVIAIHGFPEMWWEDYPNWDWHRDWHGWDEKVTKTEATVPEKDVWITETGLATVDLKSLKTCRHDLQSHKLEEAAYAPAERVYWYCIRDLCPSREAIEGFHVDENEYHLGLVTFDGKKKAAYWKMKSLLEHFQTGDEASSKDLLEQKTLMAG